MNSHNNVYDFHVSFKAQMQLGKEISTMRIKGCFIHPCSRSLRESSDLILRTTRLQPVHSTTNEAKSFVFKLSCYERRNGSHDHLTELSSHLCCFFCARDSSEGRCKAKFIMSSRKSPWHLSNRSRRTRKDENTCWLGVGANSHTPHTVCRSSFRSFEVSKMVR
jgi:hypothetical protein